MCQSSRIIVSWQSIKLLVTPLKPPNSLRRVYRYWRVTPFPPFRRLSKITFQYAHQPKISQTVNSRVYDYPRKFRQPLIFGTFQIEIPKCKCRSYQNASLNFRTNNFLIYPTTYSNSARFDKFVVENFAFSFWRAIFGRIRKF